MLLHHDLRALGVTRCEGGRQLAVVVLRDQLLLRRIPVERPVDERQLHDATHEPGEPRAPRGLHDDVVEADVLAHELGQVVARAKLLETLAALGQARNVLPRDAGGSPPGREAFEDGPKLIQIVEILGLVRSDGGAPVRSGVEETLRLEDEQRFADGRT